MSIIYISIIVGAVIVGATNKIDGLGKKGIWTNTEDANIYRRSKRVALARTATEESMNCETLEVEV